MTFLRSDFSICTTAALVFSHFGFAAVSNVFVDISRLKNIYGFVFLQFFFFLFFQQGYLLYYLSTGQVIISLGIVL